MGNFMLQPLYPGRNSPQYTLNRRLGSSRLGLDEMEKSLCPLLEIKFWIVQTMSDHHTYYITLALFHVKYTLQGQGRQ
jgi:hypothetical protein